MVFSFLTNIHFKKAHLSYPDLFDVGIPLKKAVMGLHQHKIVQGLFAQNCFCENLRTLCDATSANSN